MIHRERFQPQELFVIEKKKKIRMNENGMRTRTSYAPRSGAIAKFDVVVIDFGYDRNWPGQNGCMA